MISPGIENEDFIYMNISVILMMMTLMMMVMKNDNDEDDREKLIHCAMWWRPLRALVNPTGCSGSLRGKVSIVKDIDVS